MQKIVRKYGEISVIEYYKFIKKLLIFLFFYFFSYAVGIVDKDLHLIIFLSLSDLLGGLIWIMAIISVITFYFESEEKGKYLFITALILGMIYFGSVSITFSLISSHIQNNGQNIYHKSNLAMFSAFSSLIILLLFYFLSKRKITFFKDSGEIIDPIQNHS